MDDASVLEQRMRLLERGQRRLVVVCVTLAIGLVASVGWHTLWFPREISAQRFLLKDASGRTRGEWGPTDVIAGEIDGEEQLASATCLHLKGQKASAVDLCAPWDPHGGPVLAMREETGASLDVALDAYTVSILGRASRAKDAGLGKLVLIAGPDGAAVSVSDKQGRRTHLGSDGLLIFDSARAVVYKTPGTVAPAP